VEQIASPATPPVIAPLRSPGKATEQHALIAALAHGYCHGASIAWSQMCPNGQLVDLPTYPFERQRFWIQRVQPADVSQAGLEPVKHGMLSAAVRLPDSDGVIGTGLLSRRAQPWLADHEIGDVVLVPGTAFVEMALRVGQLIDCPSVEELVVQAPLVLPATGGVELRVVAAEPSDSGGRIVTIYARPQQDSDSGPHEWTRHATGILAVDDDDSLDQPSDVVDDVWPPQGSQPVDLTDVYREFSERGYHYGPLFQGLKALWKRNDDVFADIELPDPVRSDAGQFVIHPALLDSVLHALPLSGLMSANDDGELIVPFAWERVAMRPASGASLRAQLSVTRANRVAITLADSFGAPLGKVGALAMRALPRDAQPVMRRAPLYSVEWVPIPPPTAADGATDGVFGLHGYDGRNGFAPQSISPEVLALGDRHIAVLCLPDTLGAPQLTSQIPELVQSTTAQVQTIVQRALTGGLPVAVVTRRAVAVDGSEDANLTAAAVRGLLHSAQNEHPDRIWLVDVDDWQLRIPMVAQALSLDEPDVAVRGGRWYAARLGRAEGADSIEFGDLLDRRTWQLRPAGKGTLTSDNFLVAAAADSSTLPPGTVRVAARAHGVNFRDVLITLGMYPDPDAIIGSEFAGVVMDVAPDVTGFAPGDRVMGISSGLSAVVDTDQRVVVHMPAQWSFAQAAATPLAFATAYYALVDLAQLRRGEKLLVHAATGGVGMAAVQIARHLGAEIYATASIPKWDVLHDMGFDDMHMADSRTVEFESKFRAATGGDGCDVVLDCLAREFVDASLRLLPRGGRFIEMGLSDLRDPAQVLRDHPEVQYRGFLLGEAGYDRLGEILTTLVALFEAGTLKPPLVTAWDVRRVPELFRFMSQARHIGKNVLTVPVAWNPDGTVVITGGTGALGAAVARHLVLDRGVRRLLLISRRGLAAEGAEELRAELGAHDAHVDVIAADVGNREAVGHIIGSVPPQHPLTAVIHTAGLVDDGVFAEMTPSRLAKVMQPKVDGAWNLHEVTSGADLAAFVVYASLAAVTGNPGQSNYAAANSFLDELARHRRRAGLPATSIAWGPWRGSDGMTSNLSEKDWARIRQRGMSAIDDRQGMSLFDACVVDMHAAVVAAGFSPGDLRRQDASVVPPILRQLAQSPKRAATAKRSTNGLAKKLAMLSPPDRMRSVTDTIRAEAAAVLGHGSTDAVDVNRTFQQLGFDSLIGLEFRNRLKSSLGIGLDPTVIFDCPTPVQLADHICEQFAPVNA
jgi:NADPH:quinone reductase-like Zn-dependent oxidoreductase/acyl carrier protein